MNILLEDQSNNDWQVGITTSGQLTTTYVNTSSVIVVTNNFGPSYATTNVTSGQNGFGSPLVFSPDKRVPIIDSPPAGPGG